MEEVPEQEAAQSIEESIIIKQMVMNLPEEFREAVVLRYFQNLRYKDIADILKVSPSLVKYRVKKGLELLSELEGGSHGAERD